MNTKKSSNIHFSIITINYNNKFGLIKTVESVVSQTFKDFEYIIIDGGSTDGSKEYIVEQQNYFTYWVSESDEGIYDAMNKGIKEAKGEYLYFLNSGDYFLSNYILDRVNLNTINLPDIIYGNVLMYSEENCLARIRESNSIDRISLYSSMICHQAIFSKKSLFVNFGEFDLYYKIKADYEWLLRVVSNSSNLNIEYIKELICFYPTGGASAKYYKDISVFEIPKIKSKFYNKSQEKFVQWFFIRKELRYLSTTILKFSIFRRMILNFMK